MQTGLSAAVRRATMETRAGRLLRRALFRDPAPAVTAVGVPPLQEAAVLFAPAAASEEFLEQDQPAPVAASPEQPTLVALPPAPVADLETVVPTDAVEPPPVATQLAEVMPAPAPAVRPFALAAFPSLSVPMLTTPRGRLDEVIRLLGGRTRPDAPLPGLEVPEGASFTARRFQSDAGARDYRVYVPGSLEGEAPQGLILLLHGCTQTPEDFAVGTGMNRMAEAERLILAYPEQTQLQNGHRCWNWFRPEDQRRGGGEPAILAGLTGALVAEFAVPQDRVFVAGLSAGGAMSAVLGEAYPDLFAGVGVHSGVACGSARDARSALAAMRGLVAAGGPSGVDGPRTIVFQGDSDTTVHPSNAARLVVRAVGEGASGTWDTRTAGGRKVTRSVTRNGEGGREVELWMIEGAGHAWSGGNPAASYAEANGPDASAEMVRFFLAD